MSPLARGAVGAIDCGTNSTRLLVADPDGRPLERLMHITRLGRGVDDRRELAPDAIAATVAVMRHYREVMDRHGVERVRITATSAVRDAANREYFLAAAEDIVGFRPELLTGDEEGRLSFAGATADLFGSPLGAGGPYLVADIGGGSTELAVGPVATEGEGRRQPIAVRSIDLGCVRVTERWLTDDPPPPAQVRAARDAVDAQLTQVSADLPVMGRARTLIGLAGTVAALAAIDQGLTSYDRARLHHHVLTRSTVEDILTDLASLPAAARVERAGVEAGRADVIVGGTVVLAALMDHFGFSRCLTSEADILDGLVMTIIA